MAPQNKLIELLTNNVIDVVRRSLRRYFPPVRDNCFDEVIGRLDHPEANSPLPRLPRADPTHPAHGR